MSAATVTPAKWLEDAYLRLRPAFETRTGRELPGRVQICHGHSDSKRQAGFQIAAEHHSGGLVTIQVCAVLDAFHDVVGTLLHEMIHASGIDDHGKSFVAAGKRLGLVGKPTQMGYLKPEDCPGFVHTELKGMPPFPKGRIDHGISSKTGQPKEKGRVVTFICQSCAATWSGSRKWLAIGKARGLRCPDPKCGGACTRKSGAKA